jgi:hypothetical protein
MKRCKCGNTLSMDRQAEGIEHCPACDVPWHETEINDIISKMVYNSLSGELNCYDVMRHLIRLAEHIKARG